MRRAGLAFRASRRERRSPQRIPVLLETASGKTFPATSGVRNVTHWQPFTDGTRNTGCCWNGIESVRSPGTIIVCGLQRSGTTMLAMLLEELGVYIGERLSDTEREDQDAYRALESPQARKLIEFCERRNREHPVWGFKWPDAYRSLQ